MMAVSLSTITALEREAMAGLLQLQTERVRRDPQPEPPAQQINTMDGDYAQSATAAWVLARCLSPKEASTSNDAAKAWVIDALEDNTSSSSTQTCSTQTCSTQDQSSGVHTQTSVAQTHTHAQKSVQNTKRKRKNFRKHVVHANSRLSVCCYTHRSRKCRDCRRKVQMRDVATQTEDFSDSSIASTDASTSFAMNASNVKEYNASSRLEESKRTAMKRKQNVPVKRTLPIPPPVPFVSLVPRIPVLSDVSTVQSVVDMKESKGGQSIKPTKFNKSLEMAETEVCEDSDEEWQPTETSKKAKLRRRTYTTSSSNKENLDVSEHSEQYETEEEYPERKSNQDLVPIGDGNAKVPARLLKHMNWSSYTNATRKLLTAIFPRSVLATHSLTGKPSPAFPNKPAKKKLDPILVNDVVQTVVERCRVPENVVRTSITTKCADESKMLRTRQRNKKIKNP